ncbi:hypothetical protein B0G38_001860 [Arthrobacter sp. VKM Ac-2550]|nr:hypothetical protein [Arthrobacter sp. VKM Ac-2550]
MEDNDKEDTDFLTVTSTNQIQAGGVTLPACLSLKHVGRLIRTASGTFYRILDYADEAAAHTIEFAPAHAGPEFGQLYWIMEFADDISELRPPLLWPCCLRKAADTAPQFDPYRSLACAVGAGL